MTHTRKTQREARPRYKRRSSGWWDWELQDSMGLTLNHPTLTVSGFERAKNKAEQKAMEAARLFGSMYLTQTRTGCRDYSQRYIRVDSWPLGCYKKRERAGHVAIRIRPRC